MLRVRSANVLLGSNIHERKKEKAGLGIWSRQTVIMIDPSTSTPALVSCPVLNLLSILPLCHYMSLLLVSNRAASIITIDFYV